jgi:hypothetical protein
MEAFVIPSTASSTIGATSALMTPLSPGSYGWIGSTFLPRSSLAVTQYIRNSPSFVLSAALSDSNSSETNQQYISSLHVLSPRTARLKIPLATLFAESGLFTFVSPEMSRAAVGASKSTSSFDSSLKEFFPGSIPSSTVLLRVQSTLRKRQYLPYNTILASSLPTEEILYTPTSLISILRNKLCESKDGGIYSLGGLGGIPFAGNAGMEDLFSHAPQDGRIVIVFGPNVGIDKNGVLGRVERIGTEEYGADEANGVVVRAYRDIVRGKEGMVGTDSNTGWNLEYDYIVNMLQKMPLKEWAKDGKGGDDYAIAQISKEIYGIMEDLIQKMVEGCIMNDKYNAKVTEVTLMGGIFINRGHGSGTDGGDDYFQPLCMKALDQKTGTETNLYKQVFGDLSTPRN